MIYEIKLLFFFIVVLVGVHVVVVYVVIVYVAVVHVVVDPRTQPLKSNKNWVSKGRFQKKNYGIFC